MAVRDSVPGRGTEHKELPVRPTGLPALPSQRGSGSSVTQELVQVEGGAVLEHEVEGATELAGEDRLGLEGSFVGFEPIIVSGQQRAVTSTQDGGLADGPVQIGVAEFGTAEALDLTGTGHGALDQPGVAAEVLDGGEACDGVDLVEDSQSQGLIDAWDGLEEGVIAGGHEGFTGSHGCIAFH